MANSPKVSIVDFTLFDTFSIYLEAVSMSILKVSIRQLKAARSPISWSQEELASAANVSLPTIKRLEAVDGPLGGRQTTADKIRAALQKAGVEFIDANGGGPGVRLRKRQQTKKQR